MKIELSPELEQRLREAARQRSVSVSELTEEAIMHYLKQVPDKTTPWVQTTQKELPRVWQNEDFSDWRWLV